MCLVTLMLLTAHTTEAQKLPLSKRRGSDSVLTKAAQIRGLTADQAKRKLPIRLSGVITYHAPEYGVTFFQDETSGIFVWPENSDPRLAVGSRVRIEGNTTPGDFAPSIEHAHIRVLGHGALPKAAPKMLEALLTGNDDSQWVLVKGVVHSVALENHLPPDMRAGTPQLVLGIASGSNRFKARIRDFQRDVDHRDLVDSSIEVQGACGTLFNNRRQLVSVQLFVPSIAQVTVLHRPDSDPYSLPVLPTTSLMRFNPATAGGHRMRIQGVVTLSKAGQWIVVQDASGGVLVETAQTKEVQPGALVDAVGFPTAGRYAPILEDGDFQVRGKAPLPAPLELTATNSAGGQHDAEYVRIDGVLLDQSERAGYRVLTLQREGLTFTAQLDRKNVTNRSRSFEGGSYLRLTGVWSVETDQYRRPTAFQVLLRSADDVAVLRQAPWWTGRRILALLGVLAGLILAGLLWVRILRRQVRERTETLRATLEATVDGILVVNSAGQVMTWSQKFADMWRIPAHLRSTGKDATFQFITEQLSNPDSFAAGARSQRSSRTGSDDMLETKDGRVFEWHSEPQVVKGKEVGRVWGFRDVTERQRAQERLAARTAELDIANSEISRLNDQLKADNKRMSAELEVTRRLQQMILPREEELRDVRDLDISGFMQPASEVGGDYYDVVSKDGRVVFSIGDVTGHGLESGVMAIMVQTAVRTLLATGQQDRRQFFEVLNRVIYDNARRMNCHRNLTLSVLDYKDRVATISGQHEEVIVVRKDGTLERHDTIDLGFPLGLDENISNLIGKSQVPLAPGDVMVLYTDGITEATDSAGEGFGIERLSEAVVRNHDRTALGIREAVLGSFREHVNGCRPVDDMTLLVVRPV